MTSVRKSVIRVLGIVGAVAFCAYSYIRFNDAALQASLYRRSDQFWRDQALAELQSSREQCTIQRLDCDSRALREDHSENVDLLHLADQYLAPPCTYGTPGIDVLTTTISTGELNCYPSPSWTNFDQRTRQLAGAVGAMLQCDVNANACYDHDQRREEQVLARSIAASNHALTTTGFCSRTPITTIGSLLATLESGVHSSPKGTLGELMLDITVSRDQYCDHL